MDVLFTSHKYVIGCPIGMCKIRHRDDNENAYGDIHIKMKIFT